MAKELPYFKFEPSQWENGNIQMCSFEAQGIFINVCSMYWQRLGELPYKLAVQKICNGNATALDSLIEDQIIRVIDGMVCIDFLNEQLSEFDNLSKTNSENARVGWEKRRKDATAMRPQSKRNAIRGEERRGDKKKEDVYIENFGSGKYFITIDHKYLHSKSTKINGTDGLKLYFEANQSVINFPDSAEKFMRDNNGAKFNDFMHVYNSLNSYVKKQYA
jgi:hypothetical protein